MTKIKKAVIPAAGYGTRFLPITKVVPKELLPIGNKPAIQYVVEEAVLAGVEEIVIVGHPSKMAIIDYFKPDPELVSFLRKKGKGSEIEELERIEGLAKFTLVFQEEPLGLGHAVLCAEDAVGEEPFLVMLPDVLVMPAKAGASDFVEQCGDGREWGVLLERVPVERVSSYGIIKGEKIAERKYRVDGAVEKPRPESAPSDLSMLGRYLFPPQIFEEIRRSRKGTLGEIQLTDAIRSLAQLRRGVGVICEGRVFDVGTPDGLLEIYHYLRNSR